MDLNFEQMLAAHNNQFRPPRDKPAFDPYCIAEGWPKTPVLGNASSPFIAKRLHYLGYRITLGRIKLIKICLAAVKIT